MKISRRKLSWNSLANLHECGHWHSACACVHIVTPTVCHAPKNSQRKLSWHCTSPWNSQKFFSLESFLLYGKCCLQRCWCLMWPWVFPRVQCTAPCVASWLCSMYMGLWLCCCHRVGVAMESLCIDRSCSPHNALHSPSSYMYISDTLKIWC